MPNAMPNAMPVRSVSLRCGIRAAISLDTFPDLWSNRYMMKTALIAALLILALPIPALALATYLIGREV